MKKDPLISLAIAGLALLSVFTLSACSRSIRQYGRSCSSGDSFSDVSYNGGQPVSLMSLLSADSLSAGDHCTFGSYPQNITSGTDLFEPEPIEWRVLDVKDGKALIISEYLLDVHKFDDNTNIWTESDIRVWLNKVFLDDAFSPDEQKKLAGYVFGDMVTLLSREEAELYFNGAFDLRAAPTQYALYRGVHTSGSYAIKNGMKTGWWWLRSPDPSSERAACVSSGGFIIDYGSDVDFGLDGVRPVILVLLSD